MFTGAVLTGELAPACLVLACASLHTNIFLIEFSFLFVRVCYLANSPSIIVCFVVGSSATASTAIVQKLVLNHIANCNFYYADSDILYAFVVISSAVCQMS